jgi:exopolysaccharide biosynthesis polyprenyl glycosylphosphotransferase
MLRQHALKINCINVLTCLLFTSIAYWLAHHLEHLTSYFGPYTETHYLEYHTLRILAILVIWVILSFYFNAKLYYCSISLSADISISIKVPTIGVMSLALLQYIFKLDLFPKPFLLIFYLTDVPFLLLGRIIQHKCIPWLQQKFRHSKTLLIVGLNEQSNKFIKAVRECSQWGLTPVGAVDINGEENIKEFNGVPVKGDYESFRETLHENSVDLVAFCFPFQDYGKIKTLTDTCAEEGVHYLLVSDFFTHANGKIYSDRIFGSPVLYFSPTARHRSALPMTIKYIMDFLISLILLIVLSPLFLIISVLVKLTSHGSVFYRWKIVGKNKKFITSYKFRTMVDDADRLKGKLLVHNEMKGAAFKMTNDPRITKLGKFLRKYSLDELPQLWSVLKGQLSLVGPRPALQSDLPRFCNWQRRRMSVNPGITCLWQVNGRNTINDFDDWVKMDLEYIDNWSLWLDFKILLNTIPAVLKGTGK